MSRGRIMAEAIRAQSTAADGFCCQYCTPKEYDSEGYRPRFAVDVRRTSGDTSYRWRADVFIWGQGTTMHGRTLVAALWSAGRLAWKWGREHRRRLSAISAATPTSDNTREGA